MEDKKIVSPENNSEGSLNKLYKNPYVRYILFGLVLALVPLLAESKILPISYITMMGSVLIYTVAALGLNLLLGYSGLISLGTAGFMGLGAYVAGYFIKELQVPWIIALLVAVVGAALIGVLVGFVSLKVSGIYLAIVTLCVSEILRKTYEELDEFTGGFSGFNFGKYPNIFGLQLDRSSTYILIVIVLVLIMMLTHNLVRGQFGRAMHAMRGSEVAAQAMGINLLKYRLIVFAIATAYAALSGVLYIGFIRFATPDKWIMMLSLNILAMIVIGGFRSIYGTFFGVFLVYAVPDIVIKPLFGDIGGLSYIFSGVLIILVILFYPNGLKAVVGDLKKLINKFIESDNSKEGGKE